MTGIMCRPRNSAFLSFGYSRQRRRFSFTSRIPTVICVGCRLSMETGSSRGRGLVDISAFHPCAETNYMEFVWVGHPGKRFRGVLAMPSPRGLQCWRRRSRGWNDHKGVWVALLEDRINVAAVISAVLEKINPP